MKVQTIENGKITIIISNKVAQKQSNEGMKRTNHYNQDEVAKYVVINKIREEGAIKIKISKLNVHNKLRDTFENNLGAYILRIRY